MNSARVHHAAISPFKIHVKPRMRPPLFGNTHTTTYRNDTGPVKNRPRSRAAVLACPWLTRSPNGNGRANSACRLQFGVDPSDRCDECADRLRLMSTGGRELLCNPSPIGAGRLGRSRRQRFGTNWLSPSDLSLPDAGSRLMDVLPDWRCLGVPCLHRGLPIRRVPYGRAPP